MSKSCTRFFACWDRKGAGKATVLNGPGLQAVNTLDQPANVAPQEASFPLSSSNVAYALAPHSLTVSRPAMC